MSFNPKLSFFALLASATSLTAVLGGVTLTPPTSAQSGPVCGGTPFSAAPSVVRQQATAAYSDAKASFGPEYDGYTPNSFTTEVEEGVSIYEVEFTKGTAASCKLEIDVLDSEPKQSGIQAVTQEIELITTFSALPSAVKGTLGKSPLGAHYTEDFFEKSVRPPGQPEGTDLTQNNLSGSATIYEIEGKCNSDIEFFGGDNPEKSCGSTGTGDDEYTRAAADILSTGKLLLIENPS